MRVSKRLTTITLCLILCLFASYTDAQTKPDSPTITSVTSVEDIHDPGKQLKVCWTEGSRNGLPISGFRVERRVSGSGEGWVWGSNGTPSNSCATIPGLKPDTTYEVRVRTHSYTPATDTESDWSTTATGTTSGGEKTTTSPILISISASTSSPAPGGRVTFTVSITQDGSAVDGETVAFSVSPDDDTASLSATSATTNSSGRASTTLTLGSNATGSYTVTASVGDRSDTATVTVAIPRPPPPVSISADTSSAAPGGRVTFTATVTQDGTAADGETVAFSVSPDDGTASLSATSAITDSNGQASTTLTLGSNATGSFTVTAAAGGSSAQATVTTQTQEDESTDEGTSPPEDEETSPPESDETPVQTTTEPTPTTEPVQARAEPTPPRKIEVPDPKKVLVTEWMLLDHGRSVPQWIELYNYNTTEIDLNNWTFKYVGRPSSTFKVKELETISITLRDFKIPAKSAVILVTYPSDISAGLEDKQVYNLGIAAHQGTLRSAELSHRQGTLKTGWELSDSKGVVVHVIGARLTDNKIGNPPTGTFIDGNRKSYQYYKSADSPSPSYYGRRGDIGSPGFFESIPASPSLHNPTLRVTPEDLANAVLPVTLDGIGQPTQNLLLQNYPNPFNPETWIPYQLSEDSDVSVSIYDTTGQLVRTLSLGFQSAGFYNSRERAAYWDGRNAVGERVASGIYFYQLTTPAVEQTRRLVIVK